MTRRSETAGNNPVSDMSRAFGGGGARETDWKGTGTAAAAGGDMESLSQRMRAGLEVKDRKYRLRKYTRCFLGTDAVRWLANNAIRGGAEDPSYSGELSEFVVVEALEVGNRMMRGRYFHHVAREHTLENKKLFYRFAVDEKGAGEDGEGDVRGAGGGVEGT